MWLIMNVISNSKATMDAETRTGTKTDCHCEHPSQWDTENETETNTQIFVLHCEHSDYNKLEFLKQKQKMCSQWKQKFFNKFWIFNTKTEAKLLKLNPVAK